MFFVIPEMPSKTFVTVQKNFLITLKGVFTDFYSWGDFIVALIGSIAPLLLLVDNFVPIRDTNKTTVFISWKRFRGRPI